MMNVPEADRPPGWAKTLFAERRHAEAREVVRLAAEAVGEGARVMALRGVLLSTAGFLEPADRPLQDVDVLLDRTTLASGVARLVRAGFRIERRRRRDGSVVLSHAMHEALWLDVHSAPLPPWFGRVTSSYLFKDAQANTSLFGANVFIPSHARLMVHLIGHILKDEVVGAYRHAATDLAAVAAVCTRDDLDEIADHLRDLSLREGAVLAVLWAQALTSSAALEALVQRLEPDFSKRGQRWEQVTSPSGEPSGKASQVVRTPSKALRLSALQRTRRGVSYWGWSVRQVWITLRAWFASPIRS